MSKKEDFLNKVVQPIRNVNLEYNNCLFNSVVIAQAILETGYGTSSLMMKANAIFGIKATSIWTGKVYSSKTKEVYNNVTSIETATFRAYDSLNDSIRDYFNLICNTSRYSKVKYAVTPEEMITELISSGYATDPNYINSIMTLIDENDLEKYDVAPSKRDCTENSVANELDLYTDEELSEKVINGDFGNGDERKEKLGSRFESVQKIVNEKLKSSSTAVYYTVQEGDCLSKIAKKFKVKVSKIAELNGIENVDFIKTGDVLLIKE